MICLMVLVSSSNHVQRWQWGTWFQTPLLGHTAVESSGRTGSLLSLFQGRLTLEARNRIQKFRLNHKVQYYCTYGCVQSATYYTEGVNKYQFLRYFLFFSYSDQNVTGKFLWSKSYNFFFFFQNSYQTLNGLIAFFNMICWRIKEYETRFKRGVTQFSSQLKKEKNFFNKHRKFNKILD